MKKCYLFVYSDDLGTRDEVKDAINMWPIYTWRSDMPNSFYLVAEISAQELANHVRQKRPNGRFIITEIGPNYWGFGFTETWYLIQNKTLKPEETQPQT